ncbi:MAG TPA: hypothetical protein VMV86_02720, partial [Methanosarcinales archaeon]|nr:hypothetical protein [Methanosarcinales archaeon]
MKKIAIIADLRGWIFERHAKEIQKRLSHKFDISIGYIRGTNLPKLYQDKDLVYMMSPMIKQYPDRHKTIIGLRSE